MTLRAVLFDMDGTLVDSEKLWFQVEIEVMRWLDWPGTWGPEHQAALVGGSLVRSVGYLLRIAGRDGEVAPAQVEHRLRTGIERRLRAGVPMMPGARELLAEVRAAGLPAALVTSTERRTAELALDGIGRDFFVTTLCGDEVAHPKPDPEPYLKVAQRLSLRPAECVVVEDSPTGVAAATAAGCPTVVVPSVADVPAAPNRLLAGSLTEVSLDRLRALADGRLEQGFPARH